MRKFYGFIIPTLFLAFNVCLALYPALALESAGDGLQLWFNRVLPSLLPFAIGINALTELGFIETLGKYLAFITEPLFNLPGAAGAAILTGLTSGYPMGAKTAAVLRNSNLLKDGEAKRLAGFCNNAGPLFIIGFAGTAMFGGAEVGYKLLAAHVLSALALGVGLGIWGRKERRPRIGWGRRNAEKTRGIRLSRATWPTQKNPAETRAGDSASDKSVGVILSNAVKDAMEAMVFIGGLIVFFCVLTRMLDALGIVNGIAGGLFEVTYGVRTLAEADGLDLKLRLSLTAGIISFGGLSVHTQAIHFLSGAKISGGFYLGCKVLHGLMAFALMMLLL